MFLLIRFSSKVAAPLKPGFLLSQAEMSHSDCLTYIFTMNISSIINVTTCVTNLVQEQYFEVQTACAVEHDKAVQLL